MHDCFLDRSLDQRLAWNAADELASRIALFQRTAATVPAYRTFLDQHNIDPRRILDADSFRSLPIANKANYIQQHPLPDLCRDGRLEGCDMMAVSSGSTGSPTFWPRTVEDEINITDRFEQIFADSFQAANVSTLAVICFALGTWVGGMYTTACCRHLAAKGYRITTVTPGNNRDEILRVVGELGTHFDQTVLLGYPPFLKDVVDTGTSRGIDWKQLNIKLVMAGEPFSEEWRALMGGRTGSTRPCFDSASLYGTADAGVLANETPLSICIRRWMSANPAHARALFGESRLPTLAQYDPKSRYFEVVDGRLVFTGDNGIPLIRYDILDTGGVVPFHEMLLFAHNRGFDPAAELNSATTIRPLPFVYVFGRTHFAISYYGANLYPENISVALEEQPISDWVTGKFVMEAVEDSDRNRRLQIAVELAPGIEERNEIREQVARQVVVHLLRLNSEFASYVPAERREPIVSLHGHADPSYFPAGVKHRYTRG
jgi:phenylacetate-CoA ligase